MLTSKIRFQLVNCFSSLREFRKRSSKMFQNNCSHNNTRTKRGNLHKEKRQTWPEIATYTTLLICEVSRVQWYSQGQSSQALLLLCVSLCKACSTEYCPNRRKKVMIHSQPLSFIMWASSMINFPSLYFWLLSKACSYFHPRVVLQFSQ